MTMTALGALWLGCHTEAEPTDGSPEQEVLGVARFVVAETPLRSSVVGLDASGNEVARMVLVHGVFTLSPPFTEDYETPTVDGRKLDVWVSGQEMHWETAGYEPLFELPAHPSSQWAIAAFLDHPRAKAVLERWSLGFETFAGDALGGNEEAMTTGGYYGQSPMACNNMTSCGTAYYGTVNTCGGGAAAYKATRVTQKTSCSGHFTSYNQINLAQCCPAGSGGQSKPWFARKACPSTSSNGTACGTRTSGACKACPTYPVPAEVNCDTYIVNPNTGYCSGVAYFRQEYTYDQCSCAGVSCSSPRYCDPAFNCTCVNPNL